MSSWLGLPVQPGRLTVAAGWATCALGGLTLATDGPWWWPLTPAALTVAARLVTATYRALIRRPTAQPQASATIMGEPCTTHSSTSTP